MDASRETMSPRYNSIDANVNAGRLGERVGPAQAQASQGTSTVRERHRTLVPARSYLQLVHADYGKPSLLQRSVTRSINHSPGQAPCPGVED